jgi:hypothetical protein
MTTQMTDDDAEDNTAAQMMGDDADDDNAAADVSATMQTMK